MVKLGSFMLEMVRMLVLLLLVSALLGSLENGLFKMIHNREAIPWLFTAGNLLLYFVLYRNKLQFQGWYRSAHNRKLKTVTTVMLTGISLLFILLPFVLPLLS